MQHHNVVFEGRPHKLEILSWGHPSNGWRIGIQLAFDEQLAIPFDISLEDWHAEIERGELPLLQFLCRQAASLLTQFGDAREGRPVIPQALEA